MRKLYVEHAGWDRFPVKLSLIMTGGQTDRLDTMACWVPLMENIEEINCILAFEMEQITIGLNFVNVGYVVRY